ncbi:MAG: hypothetical protein LBD11_02385 [Candidatus Peribacteria bacterium]|jgi:hypothetical protein|nr:hypothetical protein [Candidatus Peribacteria bacterium]
MQTLQELFTISYGTKLDFNKVSVSENKKNGISFVSRTSQNNGVVAKVDEID